MLSLTTLQTASVWVMPVLFAITLHEAAHAWVATLCGDSTAKMLGRLSINPLKHIDPIGTVVVPIVIGILSGFQFIFGWAKPVPINWYQLRRPRRDMALVAIAGPIANLIMALCWAACAKAGVLWDPTHSQPALFMVLTGEAGIFINLVLAFLNIIPIPPLDGSRIVISILPPKFAGYYQQLEPFGMVILLVLMFTGTLGVLIGAPINWSLYVIHDLFHMLH
ncbi:MAG: site-2 protease family protein [Legionella sp.]|nr:MAG: site-2 protease family protein [Legionella sp.]